MTIFRQWIAPCVLILLTWSISPSAAVHRDQAPPAPGAAGLVRDAFAALDRSQLADARQQFEAAAAAARAQQDRGAEADALRGLGVTLYQQGRWAEAPKPLEAARGIYVERGDRLGEARTLDALGSIGAMTRRPDADDLYRRAIDLFAAAGERVDQARTIRNRSHLSEIPLADKIPMLQEAFGLAEGDRRLQGLILHSWGVLIQTQGRYAEALERFERARPLLDETGSPRERARLLSSMATSFQMHGLSPRAIEGYLEALALLEQIGDVPGQSQTTGLLAEAYRTTGQVQRSLDMRKRALELAEKTGSPGLIDTALGSLGVAYLGVKDYHNAIAIMEEALGKDRYPDVTTGFYRNLALAYLGANRIDDALRIATRGVDVAREKGRVQIEMGSLQVRAQIHERAGQFTAALADARAGLDALERVRLGLAPTDYLKSGFADNFQTLFGQTISLLNRTGRAGEAVAVAEQARARAFLDLLASREIAAGPSVAATRSAATPAAAPASTTPLTASAGDLTMRGGPPAAGREPTDRASASAAPVPDAATVQNAAARLQSTVIEYWVADDATFIWTMAPDGTVTSARVPVTRARLARLVRETWSMSDAQMTSRGIVIEADTRTADTAGVAANPPTPPSTASARAIDVRALPYLTTRGGDPLPGGGRELSAYRELYEALIQPVRAALPRRSGSLLTIVPHGPLFELSFAALTDGRGRFLLEDFRLHYAPSAATLEFTATAADRRSAAPGYLLIANPAVAADLKLPALPGAEREVRSVARSLRGGAVSSLVGAAATEAAVRTAAASASVVHFATHGLVSGDQPFTSYLALAPGGTGTSGDGRLTASEIYGLSLSADLVVLSACRSAGGRISGDGIVGLTRAFFAAGTPSILAAMWDLADESAEHLLPRFYAEWRASGDKSAALRAAQLSMLADLRAGRLKVKTAIGELPLPPHPVLWANLALLGEPK